MDSQGNVVDGYVEHCPPELWGKSIAIIEAKAIAASLERWPLDYIVVVTDSEVARWSFDKGHSSDADIDVQM